MIDTEVSQSETSMSSKSMQFKVYPTRWYMLLIFAILELCNALMWVTFSPISDIAGHYFGDGYIGSVTGINMMANVFLILYAPGTIMAIFSMKYFKPRNSILFAGVLTTIGCFLRMMAAIFRDELGGTNTYVLIFLGQALGALAQPYFLSFPPAMASIWFSASERDISTTIGSMCSPIGNAIGQIIPILFVYEDKKDGYEDDDSYKAYNVHGMSTLMIVEFIICLVPLVIAFYYFQDAPPTPPSYSTYLKNNKNNNNSKTKLNDNSSSLISALESEEFNHRFSQSLIQPEEVPNEANSWEEVKADIILLLKNKDFIILFSAFSIGVGFFNSILTLLNQIVSPFGYSNDDAGIFGAVFIVFGLIGAGIMGNVMEKTKAYRSLLRGGLTVSICTCFVFILLLFSDNFWPLLFSFCLMGFSVLPLLPVMMENCAEITYPVPEEIPMGILFAGSNILGLGFIFALQYLIDVDPFGPPPFLPSNFFIIGILLLAFIILLFYKGEYKRMQHDKRKSISSQVPDSDNPIHSQSDINVRVTSQDSESLSRSNASLSFWNR